MSKCGEKRGCIAVLGRMMIRGLKPSATFVASQGGALTIAAGFNPWRGEFVLHDYPIIIVFFTTSMYNATADCSLVICQIDYAVARQLTHKLNLIATRHIALIGSKRVQTHQRSTRDELVFV